MISLSGAQHAVRVAMHLLDWKVCEAAILHALFDKQKSECKETAIMLPELAANFEKKKDKRERERNKYSTGEALRKGTQTDLRCLNGDDELKLPDIQSWIKWRAAMS